MISLHKWFPFVHPKIGDVQSVAFEKRAERIEFEHEQEAKAQKVRKAIEEYDLELYNKRANQNTVEIEIFSNKRHFDGMA